MSATARPEASRLDARRGRRAYFATNILFCESEPRLEHEHDAGAEQVMPEVGEKLGKVAMEVLRSVSSASIRYCGVWTTNG